MLDHLAFATPDVQASVDELEARLGVRPSLGGHFEGRGVYNHLLSLGDGAYLEVIGPDPEQADHTGPRPFGIRDGISPGLVTWCAKSGAQIEEQVAAARERGVDVGEVRPLGRKLPDGTRLDWRLSVRPWPPLFNGLVPFLIDWGEAPHPSTTAQAGCRLASLHGEHPEAAAVGEALAGLGVELEVREAGAPALVAVIESEQGRLELRGAVTEAG